MIQRRVLGLWAGATLAAGWGGCAAAPQMVLGGQPIPAGSAVAIRGQMYTNEYEEAGRMLRHHDFVLVKDDAAMPRYVFFVEMPLTLRPGSPSYCEMELLRDGKAVEKVSTPFVEGQILQPSVAPAWHTAAFRQALGEFSAALSGAH